ncbi:hypothetical protein BaRGS_00000149 [Batillaria attramentaria]|uniref:Uncharacterized protein n=1 Tax=Batillaria attramentaria TaxID=370345 RepID=A0ABD0M9N5_9CAEN
MDCSQTEPVTGKWVIVRDLPRPWESSDEIVHTGTRHSIRTQRTKPLITAPGHATERMLLAFWSLEPWLLYVGKGQFWGLKRLTLGNFDYGGSHWLWYRYVSLT